ncbi:uncharacterized protein AruCF_2176 [Achromobacter ruhlandii]|nr:uncharacterized protein AruCF_2176 [Achromobacter ruhlandii]
MLNKGHDAGAVYKEGSKSRILPRLAGFPGRKHGPVPIRPEFVRLWPLLQKNSAT